MKTTQTKPARTLGADITQTTLQTTLDEAGIERNITNLSYVEKRLVIVASLLNQVQEANGDWGRTIESVANQTRILKEQWERLTRAIGNVFLPIVKRVLPYLNAILMVLVEIINMIARLFGYKASDFDYFTTASEDVIDFADGLGVASDNAKKLKQGLRGFDKLNVISTPTTSSTSGTSVGTGGVDQSIMDMANSAMDSYMGKLENVKMRATEIRDSIMEWLGFTSETDEETGEVSWKLKEITSGTVLGALAIGGSIYLGVSEIYKIFKKIGVLKIFDDLFKFTGITTFIEDIKTAWGLLKEGESFSEVIKLLGDSAFVFLGKIVGILAIFEGIKWILEGIKELTDPMGDKFEAIIKIIEGIALAVGGVALLLGAWPVALIAAGVIAVAFLVKLIHDNWDKIKKWFKDEWEKVKEKFKDTKDKIKKAFTEMGDKLREFAKKIKDEWEKVKEKFKLPELKIPKFPKIKLEVTWNTNVGKVKTALYKALGLDGWPDLKFSTYAQGGLPPVGQIFVANEKGPELVGHIGGQSFVANQNQMFDLLDKKMQGNVKSVNPTIIVQVGNKELAKQVITDLQDIATTNGQPIKIGD